MAERTLAALRLTFQVASSSSSYLGGTRKVRSSREKVRRGLREKSNSLLLQVLILVLVLLAIVHFLVVLVVPSVVLQE